MRDLPIDRAGDGPDCIDILLAEDNEDDAELTRLACLDVDPTIRLHHVMDGTQCLAFLRREPPFQASPRPDLVLVDINMPVMNGFDVLREISADPQLQNLVIVVLTSSAAEQDVLRMCRLRCDAYIVKPARFREFVVVIDELARFWQQAKTHAPQDLAAGDAQLSDTLSRWSAQAGRTTRRKHPR